MQINNGVAQIQTTIEHSGIVRQKDVQIQVLMSGSEYISAISNKYTIYNAITISRNYFMCY